MNHWGRIFFKYDSNAKLCSVKGQPLSNHVDNTRVILKRFRPSYFYEPTRERLFEAAHLHDEGKKEMFRIIDHQAQVKGKTKPFGAERFSYSFAGHRFRVPGKDPYVDGLIRSHHEFSVVQINREKAGLNSEEKEHFADDLYLLCMADQLEAELAVKTVEGKEGDIPRTFMEFATRRIRERPHTYTVVPWPFEPDEFTIYLVLKKPLLKDISKLSGRQIKESFEKEENFEDENLAITLRRD